VTPLSRIALVKKSVATIGAASSFDKLRMRSILLGDA